MHRPTRRGVQLADLAARVAITLGGWTTIGAVVLLFGFLVGVVWPLFAPVQTETLEPRQPGRAAAERMVLDEDGLLAAEFMRDGSVEVRTLADGRLIDRQQPFGQPPTCWSFDAGGGQALYGFADGSVRQLDFGFQVDFPTRSDLTSAPTPTPTPTPTADEATLRDGSLIRDLGDDLIRRLRFHCVAGPALDGGGTRPLLHVDLSGSGRRRRFVTLDDAGVLRLVEVQERRHLLTGERTRRSHTVELPHPPRAGGAAPRLVALTGWGAGLILLWDDGHLRRLELDHELQGRIVEERGLLGPDGGHITAAGLALGRKTLLVADDSGRLTGWFSTRTPGAASGPGSRLTATRRLLPPGGPAVHELVGSERSRLLAAGRADGSIVLLHGTTEAHLATLEGPVGARLAWQPDEAGLLAVGADGVRRWRLDLGHPEASPAALFLPVWYEGYDAPAHVWQSSSATDEGEPKLGLMPLVFGTLKATSYSLLFGAPLALLAALYTREFLDRRLRGRVKAAIEMMASMPSVVLGFLAALVVAPYVATVVPAVLTAVLTIPSCLLLGACLWQLAPWGLTRRDGGVSRMGGIAVALSAGVALAGWGAPWLEAWCFGGDLRLWLDGSSGSPVGGWWWLFTPPAALVVFLAQGRWMRAGPGRRPVARGRRAGALVELLRCALGVLVAGGLALILARLAAALGLDPRDSLMGTFEVRNALVVGFVMGFAIIPILYTLAEDALSNVPEELRLASLGTGATPWQTAVRVVVPTAASGLFSALMVGLGRAVGETMIVLMATGNTAITDWNMFNGMRALSANIAVELPEAPPASTHYRTLFLTALVLFAMTFVLNTLAEVVRRRLRRRSALL